MNETQSRFFHYPISIRAQAPADVYEIGESDVPAVDALISSLVALRQQDKIADLLLVLNYRRCLSVGARKLDNNDLLKPIEFFSQHGIPLFKSVRGGGLTYHWPGQLVCYPILKLHQDEQNIPAYMHALEEAVLRTLQEVGIQAGRKREKAAQIGLWVGEEKIASMGIRLSHWVTSYGFALNLSGDISISHFIRPCGLDVRLTTVEQQIGSAPEQDVLLSSLLRHLSDVLGRSFIRKRSTNDELQKVFQQHGITNAGFKGTQK